MNVLYATYRYDPTNPDLGSSLDYECYNAFIRAEFKTEIIGPVTTLLNLSERFEIKLWQLYKKFTKKSGLKFPVTTAVRASLMLNEAVKNENYDVVFSIFPPFFVFYDNKIPYVWYFDTTFWGQEAEWPLYGKLALQISMWEEKRVLSKAARIVTMSKWSKEILIDKYNVPAERIEIIPLFATLPKNVIPDKIDIKKVKHLIMPLKLLLVGRVYKRKGIDIAFDIVSKLTKAGIPTRLVVCGLSNIFEKLPPNIEFVGPYKKSDPQQLQEYVGWYKWAHILLHPARFEAAGIVPSEAAAFGTPTITNNVGGLATTVKHGESGIVLPGGSSAEAYVNVIRELVAHPEAYYNLCQTTRQRFERELNSRVAGEALARILREVGQPG